MTLAIEHDQHKPCSRGVAYKGTLSNWLLRWLSKEKIQYKLSYTERLNLYVSHRFKGVYSEFLVKCQSSLSMIVPCTNNIFTEFFLPKNLSYINVKSFK